MPAIRSVATAVPGYGYSSREVAEAGRIWLGDDPERLQLFERFLDTSCTEHRSFVLPLEEVLALGGMSRRAAAFEREAPPLAAAAINDGLRQAGTEPGAVGAFVFTSCTCPVIPSIDGIILEDVGLRRDILRLPLYQHGCAGGVVGLSLAGRLAAGGQPVLLCSVELCSLVFHRGDHSAAQLVGAAIFGDGAASALIVPDDDRGLVFVDSRSVLLPASRQLMGYDIMDDGPHLRLDRELPQVLAESVPRLVREFLADNSLTKEDVRWWLFHPGGAKILDFLESAFDLAPGQAEWSRQVLSDTGNLSSSSVLFVLSRFLSSGRGRSGDNVLLLGVGPGLTVELVLFKHRSR